MVQADFIKNKVIVVCGPTASGKSQLAIELAKLLNGEIISADSLAIYKDLNIGTAKPSEYEQSLVKHYMIDVVDKFSSFSVSDYADMALPIVYDLLKQGKTPIICGGTGFYINSIIFDLSYGNCQKNAEVREKYQKILDEHGCDYLYELLKKVDIDSCSKIHKNDVKRVIRALEIYETSGVKKSDINDGLKPRFDYYAFSYDWDRQALYQRINQRVDKMFECGLIEEVKKLFSEGLTLEHQSMQGIGYKEFFQFDNIDSNIENIKELIKKNSRNYAKRQITFFKKLPELNLIPFSGQDFDANKILGYIQNEQLRNTKTYS